MMGYERRGGSGVMIGNAGNDADDGSDSDGGKCGVMVILHDESGPTTVEFAVILALVLLALISAISAVSSSTSQFGSSYTTKITDAMSKSGP
ncbi:MAG: hypothetical protein JO116_05480 [Planctomycetaceae bacterium]|nr:hypothetical protein [Planctomycetaceae bacterium]